MFVRPTLGELDDDMYRQTIYDREIKYTNDMQSEDITDYEKEIQLAMGNQFVAGFADINLNTFGTSAMSQSQLLGLDLFSQTSLEYVESAKSSIKAMTAGFDFSSDWPMVGILMIGLLVAFRRGPKKIKSTHRRKRR